MFKSIASESVNVGGLPAFPGANVCRMESVQETLGQITPGCGDQDGEKSPPVVFARVGCGRRLGCSVAAGCDAGLVSSPTQVVRG